MIQKNLVYRKSAKGSEAIATRQHGLSPKLRSMLILVDARRSVDELMRLAHALGNTEQLLGQLLDQGCIEPGVDLAEPAALASPASPRAAAVAAPGTARTVSLADAQRFAARRLIDILGPSAEPLCIRLEAARNLQDFQAALARAQAMVREIRGATLAANFAAEMQAHRPSA